MDRPPIADHPNQQDSLASVPWSSTSSPAHSSTRIGSTYPGQRTSDNGGAIMDEQVARASALHGNTQIPTSATGDIAAASSNLMSQFSSMSRAQQKSSDNNDIFQTYGDAIGVLGYSNSLSRVATSMHSSPSAGQSPVNPLHVQQPKASLQDMLVGMSSSSSISSPPSHGLDISRVNMSSIHLNSSVSPSSSRSYSSMLSSLNNSTGQLRQSAFDEFQLQQPYQQIVGSPSEVPPSPAAVHNLALTMMNAETGADWLSNSMSSFGTRQTAPGYQLSSRYRGLEQLAGYQQSSNLPIGTQALTNGRQRLGNVGSVGGAFVPHTRVTTNFGSHAGRRSKLPFLNSSSAVNSGSCDHQNFLKHNFDDNSDGSERYSRKVFVGGLPPDIDEEEIKASFRRFGSLVVDWPHKAESKSYFPPKGYAFLLFHEESSVQALIDACLHEDDKLYLCVSSPTIKDKPVQIRPWRLSDADFVLDSTLALDPRKTVFVGGVPRPLRASELANTMNNLYGGVCYAGIDTDPELKYPKGAGRVAFSNHASYIAAISTRFVQLHHSEMEKRVEIKPYVLDDQFCDACHGARCGNKFAPFFCSNIECLQYYCEGCWSTIHSQQGKEFHKPLVKEGAERPRGVPLRW